MRGVSLSFAGIGGGIRAWPSQGKIVSRECVVDGLSAQLLGTVHTELVHDANVIRFEGSNAEVELLGNGFVAVAESEELVDPQLLTAQIIHEVVLLQGLVGAGAEERFALEESLHRPEEGLCGFSFGDVAAGAGVQCRPDEARTFVHGVDQNAQSTAVQVFDQLDPGLLTEGEIDDDEWLIPECGMLQGFAAVVGLSCECEPCGFEQVDQAFADHRVVIDQEVEFGIVVVHGLGAG